MRLDFSRERDLRCWGALTMATIVLGRAAAPLKQLNTHKAATSDGLLKYMLEIGDDQIN